VKTSITGNTYPVKEQLKALGATWNAGAKAWEIEADQAQVAFEVVAGKAAVLNGQVVRLERNRHDRLACPDCGAYCCTDTAIKHLRRCSVPTLQIQSVEAAPVATQTPAAAARDRYEEDFQAFKAGFKTANDCQNTDY